MLEQGMGYAGSPQTAKVGECKRDYEAEIKREREKLTKVTNLKDALLDYTDGRTVQGPLAELLGELITWEILHNKQIEGLIQAQEKENG